MAQTASGLLSAANAGDASAFDALVGPLVEPGYRLAVRMLGSRDEAEDAIQEATIKAWRSLQQLRADASVRSWFLTIVANQCRSMRRGRWWSVVKLRDPERESQGPEDEAIRQTDMSRALAGLNPDDRLALYLRYYMDLTLPEVAAVLGISETAAKSRVHRAMERLRPALDVADMVT
jgi:RNA polymerase sigma-70 factor (ECF subfamily)